MLLDSRSHLPSPSPKNYDKPTVASSDTSESSSGSHDSDPAFLATCSVPTPSLLVTNLPTLLFSQAQDLHPLFFPFGHIEKLEIVQVSPLGTMSVVVRYSAAHVAQEAKETLSGQLYGSYQIEACYVKPIGSNPFFRRAISLPMPLPSLPSAFPGNFQDNDSRLSSVDSRYVYFVSLFLLPVSLSIGGTRTKDMDFNYINANSLCRIKYTTTLSIRALLLEYFPFLGRLAF